MAKETSSGTSFLTLLAILFIGLKLTGVIDWAWWIVLAPIWGGLVFALLVIGLIGLYYLVKYKKEIKCK